MEERKMPDEKRMIMDYEVTTAVKIGGTELVFCEDIKVENPFMVCNVTRNNVFNAEEYGEGVAGSDYVEMMADFLGRAQGLLKAVEAERAERGISAVPLTAVDCIEDSYREDYTNQLLVIKPESMTPAARTADHQLFYAAHGNGCNPDTHGTGVYGQNLFTGNHTRWERYDIAGIIRPDRMPAWAKEKLAALKEMPERPSLLGRLAKAKQEAAAQNMTSVTGKHKSNEL
jgi:hypothetical protein